MSIEDLAIFSIFSIQTYNYFDLNEKENLTLKNYPKIQNLDITFFILTS